MDYTSHVFSKPPEDVDEPIIIDADNPTRTISWQRYGSSVKRLAVGLQKLGVSEQECVACLSPNEIYLSILGDGVTAAGAIFATCHAEGKHSELVDSCNAAKVKWLFATPELLDTAVAVAREIKIPDQQVLLFDPPGFVQGPRISNIERVSFSYLIETAEEHLYKNPNISKDPQTYIAGHRFTSGTTGAPKAAEYSHALNIFRAEAGPTPPVARDARFIHAIGMHHATGMIHCQKAVIGKYCLYITKANDAVEVVDKIQQYKITHTLLPPRMMVAITELVKNNVRDQKALQTVKDVVIAGTTVGDECMDAFQSVLPEDAVLKPVYGSTESGPVSSGEWRKRPQGESGYVGHIVPTATIKLIDPNTEQEVGFNTDGEVCAKGPDTFCGYCGNIEATNSAFHTDSQGKKWVRTGDKGRLSADGALHITGRYKEIFKVGTEEVAPVEVELVLSKHPSVQDVAVTPVQGRSGDEKHCEVKAWIVKKVGKGLTPQELVDHVVASLSAHKAPTGGVTFVSEIPRNAMKKVMARKLEDMKPLDGSSTGFLDVTV